GSRFASGSFAGGNVSRKSPNMLSRLICRWTALMVNDCQFAVRRLVVVTHGWVRWSK
ncbi:hypothetical protein P3T23_005707, partial [Paraburkholderia sp. GAS448]